LAAAEPNIASLGLTVAGRSIFLWAAPDGGTPFMDVTLGTDKVFQTGYGVMDTAPTGGPGTAHFGTGVRAFEIAASHDGCGPVTWDVPVPGGLNLECPVWATPTDGTPTIPVLSPDGTKLFVRTSAGTLYALDAATGAVLWTAGGLGAAGKPALAQGILWVPTGTGQVLPYAAAGCGAATCEPSIPWFVDTGTGQAVTDVTVVNDVVFAVSAGTVFAVNGCRSGACPAEWSGPGSGSPVVSNGRLYVTDGNATLIAYGLPS
jgi:outer membrane protein assembly factor BamB